MTGPEDVTLVPAPMRRQVRAALYDLDRAVRRISDPAQALHLTVEYPAPVMRIVLVLRRPGEQDVAMGFTARMDGSTAAFVDVAAAVDQQLVRPFLVDHGLSSRMWAPAGGNRRIAHFLREMWRMNP